MKLNRRGDIFMVAPAVINDSCDRLRGRCAGFHRKHPKMPDTLITLANYNILQTTTHRTCLHLLSKLLSFIALCVQYKFFILINMNCQGNSLLFVAKEEGTSGRLDLEIRLTLS